MENNKKETLLEYFNVKNQKELLEYMINNPDDEKTQELKEILELFNINLKDFEDFTQE